MLETMEKTTQKADVIWFKEPERIEDFDSEIYSNSFKRLHSMRMLAMSYLYNALYRHPTAFTCDRSRQMIRGFLAEFPEFVEEVRAVRPELLEM